MAADDRCETWEAWNTIRGLCGYSPRLTLSESSGVEVKLD